jgi:hypothetical protein
MWLEKEFGLAIYYWPRDEVWMDGYCDGAYDLIVLDEYRAQKKITHLNPILSGDPVPVSRRGQEPVIKRDVLPVIIMSNWSPLEAYHKCTESQLAPLLDRITFVDATSFIRIISCSETCLETDEEDPPPPPPGCELPLEPVPLPDDPLEVEFDRNNQRWRYPWDDSAMLRLANLAVAPVPEAATPEPATSRIRRSKRLNFDNLHHPILEPILID